MANRKIVIYQSEALYVGPSPATGAQTLISQLSRIQTANYSYSVARQDINQYGQLAAIDRIILSAPTVSLDFSYYLTNGANEKKLGFDISGSVSCIKDILSGTQDEKNYFVSTSPEGKDNIGFNAANREVWAFGNGYISNYSMEAAVGGLPTVSVTVEALNIRADPTASGEASPAINPTTGQPIPGITYTLPQAISGELGEVSALRPGDIEINAQVPFGAKTSGEGRAKFQNISIEIPLSREPLEELGSKFAFSREIQFPVTVSINATANVADLKHGALSDILCNDESYDLDIILREPQCTGVGPVAMKYTVKGAKLDSQNISSSIGSNKSVTYTWTAQIGSAEDTDRGVFMLGSYIP